MAGRRRKTVAEHIDLLDEQIQQIKEKLDEYTMNSKRKIKELEEQRQYFVDQKKSEEVRALYEMLEEKGLTAAEVEVMISEKEEKIS